jgi:hypothetical protein
MSGQQSILVCQGDEPVSPFFPETLAGECFDFHSLPPGRAHLPQQLA